MTHLKVLVGCEFSGVVRDAFIAKGHDAWSCDLLPTERPGPHYQCDILAVIPFAAHEDYSGWLYEDGWDMMVAFPPCTHLAVSGARWFKEKISDGRQQQGIDFFIELATAPILHICIENPVGIMSTRYRKPDQIIQPWMFGHGETKATCLWLKGLPKLIPTDIVEGREHRVHRMPPGPTRARDRARTYPGIAKAMSEQWST